MIEPSELFAKLTCELEDLHGIAVEGQRADQPAELLLIFAEQICNGLQRCTGVVAKIAASVGST